MSVVSRLVVVHSDARVLAAVRLGFVRQGADVVSIAAPPSSAILNGEPPQLVVVGAEEADQARALLEGLRREVEGQVQPVPILYLGNGISRDQALAAGASEYLAQPAFLRDVVTVGNLLASPRRAGAMAGELGEHFGLYFLVRALLAVKRTGVLTLVRGLRRGELRFYQGELTSAQVGVLHGQAAFHQLLLWTEGRFEFRAEQLVQRRQIPLDASDLLADAELFLAEVRTIAPGISPSTVFAQDVARAAAAAVPVQVAAVLGLFDGHRCVADVIEDSPYRVFETLRVSQRLAEIGAIKPGASARTRAPGSRTALGIEEWLVGDPTPLAHARPDSEPPLAPRSGQAASPPRRQSKKERRRTKRNGSGPRAVVPERAQTPRIDVEPTDWASILPPTAGASDGVGMSPVVPSTMTSGEIDLPERRQPDGRTEAAVVVLVDDEPPPPPARERLEQVTDSDLRARIFPAEPTAPTEADPSNSAEMRAATEVARKAVEQARAAAEAAARAEAEAERAQRELARAKEEARKAAEAATVAEAAAEEDDWKSAVAAAKQTAAEEDDWRKAVQDAKTRPVDDTEPTEKIEPTEPIPKHEIDELGVVGSPVEAKHSRSGEIALTPPPGRSEPLPAPVEASIVVAMEPAPPQILSAPPPPAEPFTPSGAAPGAAERGAAHIDISHHHEMGRAAEEAAVMAAAAQVMPRRITPVPGPAPVDLAAHAQALAAQAQQAARVASHAASAVTFTDDDEAFFSAGKKLEQAPAAPAESFTDLDDGYQPQGFWQRLRGTKTPPKGTPAARPPGSKPPGSKPPGGKPPGRK